MRTETAKTVEESSRLHQWAQEGYDPHSRDFLR